MTTRRPVFGAAGSGGQTVFDSAPPPAMWRVRARLGTALPWSAYCRVFSRVIVAGRVDSSILTDTYGYTRPSGAPRAVLDVFVSLLGSL